MYLRSKLLTEVGVVHGFCTRQGGVSLPPFDSLNFSIKGGDTQAAVDTNVALLAERIGIPAKKIYWAKQESRDQVFTLPQDANASAVSKQPADALITNASGSAVAIKTADCLPVLLADSQKKLVAAVHVGWRGALLGILTKALAELQKAGAKLKEIRMATGPAIGPDHLRLGGEAAKGFLALEKDVEAYVREDPLDSKAVYVDLAGISAKQAQAAGVLEKNIEILRCCTYTEKQRFFSYRRQGTKTGHHLSFIGYPTNR